MPRLTAQEGPLKGLVLELAGKKEWILGRDETESDLVLPDTSVSRRHVRITQTDEGLLLKNLSRTNPTMVNGEIAKEHLLQENDTVQIGSTLFIFTAEAVAPKPKGGYDDIFGDLEELPPEPEPVEAVQQEALTAPSEEKAAEEAPKTAYDTIFEDLDSQEPLPNSLLISEAPLILKVIGGPNAGAEIGREKGRSYLIGKDPNTCDIVFQDLSVSRNHARLHVSADGLLELEDLGSKNGTVINGARMTEKRLVTSQDLIAMGTTIFLIIDREALDATIFSPIPSIYEAPQPQAPEAPLTEVVVVEEAKAPTPDWKSQKIPGKYLVIAGSLLLTLFIVSLSFCSLFKSENIELVQKAPTEHIKEALAKFTGVQFSFNPASGKLFLTGHVLTATNYQELKYNLSLIHAIQMTDDTVVIDEYVWKMMNDLLSLNAAFRSVSVISYEPGRFIARGYVETADQMALLSDMLTMNFPYLDRLQNKVVSQTTLQAEILGMLQEKGFGAVTLQLAGGEVILSGRYSDKEEHSYKETLSAINKLDGVNAVKDLAMPSKPSAAGIDLSQNYQVTGNAMFDHKGYSVIVNGRIFTLGDSLDGMRITAIEPNSILLEKDGLKYKINYSR